MSSKISLCVTPTGTVEWIIIDSWGDRPSNLEILFLAKSIAGGLEKSIFSLQEKKKE